jgi:uracil-DNA glycosylase family 4
MRQRFPNAKFVPPQIGSSLRLGVGEAPGQTEEEEGIPFCGSAGAWLDSMYRKAGVRKDEVTLINTIQCRPPQNLYPTDAAARSYIPEAEARQAVEHCMAAHVRPLLNSKPWTRIDTFGEKALREITGKEGGVMQWRGSPLPVKGEQQTRVVPTIHPAFIARDQSLIPVVINDLKKNPQAPPEFYNLTPSLEDVQKFTATEFACDLECDMHTQRITVVGFSAKPYHAIVVPFQGAYIPEIKRIFNAAKLVFLQNGLQFDVPLLEDNGVKTAADIIDIMLGHHLLFPDLPHDLEFIASQLTNKGCWKHEGRGKPGYWELRNARDTDVTLQIGKVVVPMLKQEKLWDLYNNVQVPLAKICKAMETTGFKVDPNRLKEVHARLSTQIAEEETKLPETLRAYDKPKRKRVPAPEGTLNEKGKPVKFAWEETPERIAPWRSSKSLAQFLYKDLGLPPQLHPKSRKITTDKGAIEKCIKILRRTGRVGEVDALRSYLKLKKAATLISSFVTDDMSQQAVGRIHPHFNVHGTSSGRLSSSDPNLQNQPETARYIYVPSHPDWSIIDVDFSNIEPRLTAYFAQDMDRLARFAEPGYNEHKWTTSKFFDIPYDQVVKDNDRDAPYGISKRINNGLNYGMGAMKIANTFDMDYKVVKDLVYKWKVINAKTAQWQTETAERAKADGFLTTPFGRKRYFYTTAYYTESLSFLPQSSAADVIFKAMISLYHDRINWPVEKAMKVCPIVEPLPRPARMLLSVHDSLVFEVPNAIMDECVSVIKRVMEAPIRELGGMRFPVEVKTGPSWAECVPYKFALPLAA